VIAKDFAAQWFRPEIDLCELAKLRKAGWTLKRLAKHFGRPKTSIVERLARLGLTNGTVYSTVNKEVHDGQNQCQ
jgi:Zn-dependent peptidase ImmA (M78 family)